MPKNKTGGKKTKKGKKKYLAPEATHRKRVIQKIYRTEHADSERVRFYKQSGDFDH